MVAQTALYSVGRFDLVQVVYGTDFKGLFGQETVPYGVVVREAVTGQFYCALRGTDSAKEWMEDFWAVPEPWPFAGHTHKGFTDVYQTLVVGVTPLAEYLRDKMAIVTGHSLGAALANLLAADLGPDCRFGCTFEGPRVGDIDFVQWMNKRVLLYRYVIIGDAVPHAPPENLGYFHAGIELDLNPGTLLPHSDNPLEELADLHILVDVVMLLKAA